MRHHPESPPPLPTPTLNPPPPPPPPTSGNHMDGAGEVSLTSGHTAASVTQHAALVSCCYSTSTAACDLALDLLGDLQTQSGAPASFRVKHISWIMAPSSQWKEIYCTHGSFNRTNEHKWPPPVWREGAAAFSCAGMYRYVQYKSPLWMES